MGTKILLNSCLSFCIVICSLAALAQDNCKEIKATIEVFQAGQKTEKASFKIDFKGQPSSLFSITLIGPKGYSKKDITEDEIKGLDAGSYTLVFAPKDESSYCMKHFQFTIK
ncbi:MAG TPA: hypothetical protein VL728_05295 [Cyclobacteriaceae bacterium]|jgi:hypothetical protein|nr:hypothetical protein [Cyclobacteriaceae bacterium]